MDHIRSARHVKILLDSYLDGETTLWIDNSVTLLSRPELFVDEWLTAADVAAPIHSFRATLLDEFNAVAAESLDDTTRIYEQLVHYAAIDAGCLQEKPHWTGMFARRANERTAALMRLWYDHVLRFSRRDQLSFNFVLRRTDASISSLLIDNAASVYHRWPTAVNRLPDEVRRGFSGAFIPDIAGFRRAETRVRELEANGALASSRIASLEEERADLINALHHREELVKHSEERRSQLEATSKDLELVLSSKSWRMGAPLRWGSTWMRRLLGRA
jgi:hypothetical protein